MHVHVEDPQSLLDAAKSLGRVVRPKFDDMTSQHRRAAAVGSGATSRIALLALCHGDGFHSLFENIGARTADLGTTTKPSAGQIAGAADAIGAPTVVVLPNHTNVLPAAEQSVVLARAEIRVLPTKTLAQGVSAALAFDNSTSVDDALAAMESAAEGVRTVEVSRANADRTVSSIQVTMGDWIAVVDGDLRCAAPDLVTTAVEGLRAAGAEDGELATLYLGAGTTDEDTERITAALGDAFDDLEIESVRTDQPTHALIASVE